MPTRTNPPAGSAPLSRRNALGRLILAGAAVGGIVSPLQALEPGESPPSDAGRPPVRTPAAALAELTIGNTRFVDGRTTGLRRTMLRLKDVTAQQSPFAAVLSCADSRVPVEILFDQGIGDMFVCRVAGNVVTPELIASLEFGTLVLGAKALVILGHTGCGAVSAAMQGKAVPGQISVLYQRLHAAVERAGSGTSDDVVRENVRIQVRLLSRSSPVIADLVKEGRLVVTGGIYDLATGRVTYLES